MTTIQQPPCYIGIGPARSELLLECGLVAFGIYCTILLEAALAALDPILQDLLRNSTTNCEGRDGAVVACGFRQTLPVVPRGNKAYELQC